MFTNLRFQARQSDCFFPKQRAHRTNPQPGGPRGFWAERWSFHRRVSKLWGAKASTAWRCPLPSWLPTTTTTTEPVQPSFSVQLNLKPGRQVQLSSRDANHPVRPHPVEPSGRSPATAWPARHRAVQTAAGWTTWFRPVQSTIQSWRPDPVCSAATIQSECEPIRSRLKPNKPIQCKARTIFSWKPAATNVSEDWNLWKTLAVWGTAFLRLGLHLF